MAKKKKSEVDDRRLELTKKLNKQQKLFCYLYVVEDMSLKDAYRNAYPQKEGVSDRQICANASRLYAKPHIKEYCNYLLEDMSKSIELTSKSIINGFMQIAFGDDSSDNNKIKALENLAKIKGLYKEEKTITHQVIKIDIEEDEDDVQNIEEPNENVIPAGCVVVEEEDEE